MEETILVIILAAGCVGLLVWSASQFLAGSEGQERKRLYRRLTSEGRPGLEPDKAFTAIRREVALTGASGVLIHLPGMLWLHHALEQTWTGVTIAKFLSLSLGLALIGLILAGAFFGSLLLGLSATAVGAAIPFIVLNVRRANRQKLMADQLPEALDFLGRVLRAGHSLSTGLQMIGTELPDPLAAEFRRAYDAHSVGRTLEDALKEATIRVDSTDFGFFVTAILIQRQTGGDLAEVLDNISDMIRGRIRLQNHVKAKTAEGRFTGYILTAFPIIMFFLSYALNPGYASVLLTGSGLYLLGTAIGLCALGLYFVRRITRVQV